MAFALLAASPLAAADRFRAIQPRVAGAPGGDMIRISVSINDYTSADEARLLQQAAGRGGSAVLDALRRMNHGSVSVAGAGRTVIYAAHASASSTGRHILIVCSLSQAIEAPAGVDMTDAVQIIELQVDGNGRGDGRLIDAAAVRLDGQGFVEIDRQLTVPKLLVEVRPDK